MCEADSTNSDITAQGYAGYVALMQEERHETKKKDMFRHCEDTFRFSHYEESQCQEAWPFMAHNQILPLCLPASGKNNRLNQWQKTPQSFNTQNQWLRIAHVTF